MRFDIRQRQGIGSGPGPGPETAEDDSLIPFFRVSAKIPVNENGAKAETASGCGFGTREGRGRVDFRIS